MKAAMRAIFLDRDGVICENRSDHVKRWSEFRFLPQAKTGLAALSRLGLPIVVVTNQAAIHRGLVTTEAVEGIHQQMITEIMAGGGRIDRVYYCPHRPDEKCRCRKPESGMLLEAAQSMGIDLARSYLVGDAATDLMAGNRVGCRTFLVLTGRGIKQLWPTLRAIGPRFTIVRNLAHVIPHIVKAERGFDLALNA
jgi:D-glycero-D-manno-heptose 1,7-bisphosphate phosphatase